jgi:hypothetical protein
VDRIRDPGELLPGGQAQPRQAAAEHLQRDLAFQPGQRRADAEVDAVTEGEVRPGLVAA